MRDEGKVSSRLVTPAFVTVTVSSFAYFASAGATLPVTPLFIDGPLGGTNFQVGMGVGAFSVSAILLRPFAGRLGDTKGRRILMVAGAAAVALAMAAHVAVTSLPFLILLRLIAGAGEAMFFTGAASAVSDLASDERRGEAVSIFSLSLYAGLAVGPLIGEAVFEQGGFAVAWLLTSALAALATVLALRLPVMRPAEQPQNPSLIHRSGLAPGYVIGASVAGFAGWSSFVPLYALELGMAGSRFAFFLYSGLIILVRAFGARIPDNFGAKPTAIVSLFLSSAGLVVMSVWGTVQGLYSGVVLLAAGQSLAFPGLLAMTVNRVPAAERGSVIATFTAFLDIAFGVGPILLGIVAEAVGYRGAFAAAALIVASGLLVLRGIRVGPAA